MIKIKKSANPPAPLISKGNPETIANNKLFDSDPEAYKAGDKKIKIDNDIYGHKTVKEQLIAEQYGKCCFCEADFTANSYGDVEHFRPKGGYRQNKSDKLKKPGYYWQAYEWNNLFFSCQICNSRYKKNYFPLVDDEQRALSHHDNIANEEPLLVHPSNEDPETHIGFRKEVCFAKDDRGEKSISAFGINRDKLVEIRLKHLNDINNCIIAAGLGDKSDEEKAEYISDIPIPMTLEELDSSIQRAQQILNIAAKDGSPFAGMIRHNYPDLPRE